MRVGQSRRWSLIETTTNTVVGFAGSYLLMAYAVPAIWPNIQPSQGQSFAVVVLFTVWSLIRGYGLRRFFNWLHIKLGG